MEAQYIDFDNPPKCPKCEVGHLHIEFGDTTKFKAECDSCDHSFPVVPVHVGVDYAK